MTTNSYDAIYKPSVAETVQMLKNAEQAIGWALEHLPHQMVEFFTEWKAYEDDYLWSINMTAWVEYATAPLCDEDAA